MAEEKLLVKRDGDFCYPIYFENDFSFLSEALKEEGLAGRKMCIVSDSNVAEPLFAKDGRSGRFQSTVAASVSASLSFPAGEAAQKS